MKQIHSNTRNLSFLLIALLFVSFLRASKTEEAFKALSIYDYFKAKTLFYKDLKKNTAPGALGLAVIYSRGDNPFTNHDSAAKYVHLGFNAFKSKRLAQSFSGFTVDSVSFQGLCDSIAAKNLLRAKKINTVEVWEKFLVDNYLCRRAIIQEAIDHRDELEFRKCEEENYSASTHAFIVIHPLSVFLNAAKLLKDRQVFNELTTNRSAQQYISFIAKHPYNIMLNTAFESLFNIYRASSDVKGLKHFVASYSTAPQYTEAWKLLFALTVKSFSNAELEKFLSENPAFPFKKSILKELELNKLTLYPWHKDDFSGFVDSTGKPAIQPVYDAVSPFSEGLAVVSKNDSVYFINKENTNVFNQFYSEAYSFKNGIAAVKNGGRWRFINRQGQPIEYYDEINELSDDLFVVKRGEKFGAVDNYGRLVVEPRFDKLGYFKNGFAYYSEKGKYGFVSKNGTVYKAEFDWISDFSEKNLAIFRQASGYGIVNSKGEKLIETAYDQIIKAANNVFIVVKNAQYGFFHGSGCYLTQVHYDFLKEKPAEYYTNGYALKLLKKNEEAIVDFNGRLLIDFGAYEEVNFATNGLIRFKKRNKYGFADRKLAPVIANKFSAATDFSDSVAIVKLKEKTMLINTGGKEIFSSAGDIEKISKHYYTAETDQTDLVNYKGEKVFTNIKNLQKLNNSLLIITLSNDEIKLIRD